MQAEAQQLVPSDDNGLADPYVRISLGGVTKETHLVKASLNPIWYESIKLPVTINHKPATLPPGSCNMYKYPRIELPDEPPPDIGAWTTSSHNTIELTEAELTVVRDLILATLLHH